MTHNIASNSCQPRQTTVAQTVRVCLGDIACKNPQKFNAKLIDAKKNWIEDNSKSMHFGKLPFVVNSKFWIEDKTQKANRVESCQNRRIEMRIIRFNLGMKTWVSGGSVQFFTPETEK